MPEAMPRALRLDHADGGGGERRVDHADADAAGIIPAAARSSRRRASSPPIRSSPDADERRPPPMNQRTPTRSASLPEIGATTNESSVIGRKRTPDSSGGVAEDVLHVERQVQEHREHRRRQHERGDGCADERRHAEQREVEHRARARALDEHERDQQHDGADQQRDDQRLPQPSSLPRISPKMSTNSAAENRTSAGPSMPPACSLPTPRRSAASARSRRAPIGRLTKKIASQPMSSVRTPPTSGPIATAAPVVAPQRPNAVPRSRAAVRAGDQRQRAWRTSDAPPTPCSAAREVQHQRRVASPHSTEATVKTHDADRRRPRRRPTQVRQRPARRAAARRA